MRRITVWALLSLAWAGGIVTFALRAWPRLPLDMSRADPATLAALDRAVFAHAAFHAGLAVLPPLVVLALGWMVLRRSSAAAKAS